VIKTHDTNENDDNLVFKREKGQHYIEDEFRTSMRQQSGCKVRTHVIRKNVILSVNNKELPS